MKFIHVSDVKLNEVTPKLFEGIVDFAEERQKSFQKIIEDCNKESADFLLITGNLFAGQPSEEDLKTVDGWLSALKNTYTVILPGEMDQAKEDSPYRSYHWNSSVVVFLGNTMQRAYFESVSTEIAGIGYLDDTWDMIRPEQMKKGRKGDFQLLLMPIPGSTDSMTFPNGMTEAAFDYVGIRSKSYYSSEGHAPIYGPGELMPSEFTRQAKHGYYLGELTTEKRKANKLSLQFVPSCNCEFLTLQVTLTPELAFSAVTDLVSKTIRESGDNNYYQVILQGRAYAGIAEAVKDNVSLIERVLAVDNISVDEQGREIDTVAEKTALRDFLNSMNAVEDETIRQRAIEYGIRALQEAARERKA